MVAVQAHILSWGVLRDGITDCAADRAAEPDLLRLLFEAHVRLSRLFGARDPFWTDYRRILRQQVESDRWERTGAGSLHFGARLIRQLGRKAALVRWPAAAVARRLGRADLAGEIDCAFEDLLEALQLIDDVVDAEQDAEQGQINAVLVAGGPWQPGVAGLQARIARGIPVACAAARLRLRRLSRCPGGIGNFSCRVLAGFDQAERVAMEQTRRHAAAAILARLIEPDSDPPPVARFSANAGRPAARTRPRSGAR
jgi:hypothetical protein